MLTLVGLNVRVLVNSGAVLKINRNAGNKRPGCGYADRPVAASAIPHAAEACGYVSALQILYCR